jgi:Protein of unknown function DUF262
MATKPLKLSHFRKKLPFNINHGMADISLRSLLKHKDYQIDFDVYLPTKGKNLQRPFVWTLFQKRELILSKLKGVKLAPISVINFDHKIYKIIDGKQRLSTLISFVQNEFSIEVDGEEFYFDDLDEDTAKGEFLYQPIYADIGYEYPYQRIADDDLIAWFEMINFSGTPQDAEHLKNLKS